jgi:hypothetical protein
MMLLALLLLCQQPRTVVVPHGADLQQAVDLCADGNGGTVVLPAGATFEGVRLVLPYTNDRRYAGIKIVGNRTTLRSSKDATEPVLHVGRGWSDWAAPKLTGIEISGLVIVQQSNASPRAKGIWIEATDGSLVDGCEFRDCKLEALYEGGGHSNTGMAVVGVRASGCGRAWTSGPLAAFNLNGYRARIIDSHATDCGWGLESGGTELTVTGCTFTDSPVALGSTVYGCSNQTLTRSTFTRSYITVGNGIGKVSDVRIVDNTLTDSPIVWTGAALTNRVELPGLPFSPHTSVVMNNTFVGRTADWRNQSLRLTAWYPQFPPPPLRVVGNRMDTASGQAVISQGQPGKVSFEDNAWPEAWHSIYRNLPTGEALPDPLPHWTIKRGAM